MPTGRRRIDVGDRLKKTLEQALAAGRGGNRALDALIADYARYHLALVVVGGLMLLAVSLLVWWCARRAKAAAREGRRWTSGRVTLLGLAAAGGAVSLLLAVVVAANIGTAVSPDRGFEGAVASLGVARAGTGSAAVHDAYAGWIASASSDAPPGVEEAVGNRLAWQAPKAGVTTVLLVLAACWVLHLVRRLSHADDDPGQRVARRILSLAVATVTAFVLMLMVMGNTQAAVAPVAITMFLG